MIVCFDIGGTSVKSAVATSVCLVLGSFVLILQP